MTVLPRILVLHGANLGALGTREKEIYGGMTLSEIDKTLVVHASGRAEIVTRQSNHEGVLIDALLAAESEGFAAVVFNPGAYAHTSYALFDAVRATSIPVVEVHLSNVFAREAFRHELVIAPAARGVISGLGVDSYRLGIDAALRICDVGARHASPV